ncbi:MAG: T9SS type A sorting domain-containing protein [Ignavibacteriaceae bacterium]|nr:T9SS type A sorting domain-containing protein [Ignavibacteriaceae bacterium]
MVKKLRIPVLILFITVLSLGFRLKEDPKKDSPKTNPPIYIAFLWHMHQPIYFPYESVIQTDQNNRYPFSVIDIHNQRTGPYTSWPKNAVMKGVNANLPHFGAQVSFSGSLIENLNALEGNGNGNFVNWKSHWNFVKNQNTSLGNPRLDMVGFGYFHPLMGLIDYTDIRRQIKMHKDIFNINFPGTYSKGIFPPENAFVNRMIPGLKDEGIEWVLVDNVHFDRAAQGYPFSTGGNLYEPNKADQINPNPGDWVQLNGLWAPTRNSAAWGRRPHYAKYIDPATGQETKIIVVPADRYMGNEDGRGGFGALNYEAVMSQLESYNTDPNHPILIVLHHDGDNYGGGSESYYGSNFQNFVNWLLANPGRFVCTTIQDYLEMFPPDPNDVIHVESGSWSGADNGDPEFKKWLGDPDPQGYSPDRNSWAVITAAKNYVYTAEQINPNSSNTQNAWKYLMVGQASDYWYWDGSLGGIWDSHPTRASNQAVTFARNVTTGQPDNTPPTLFIPQREPYNPGGTEWNIQMPSNFEVWTYAYDISGLKSVKLYYREDADGVNSPQTNHNETYAGGADVGAWQELPTTAIDYPSQTTPQPIVRAKKYFANVTGINNKLLDYYMEAIDSNNNVTKTAIQHVWVGQSNSGGGGGGGTTVSWLPVNPTKDDTITIKITNSNQGAKLHWGVNYQGSTWSTPNQVYWPAGSALFNGTGPAVESPFAGPDTSGTLTIRIGPLNNAAQTVNSVAFVIHYNDNTWNNNNGQDFHIDFGTGGGGGQSYVMDGQLDASAKVVSQNSNGKLYLDWNGTDLYIATESAQQKGNDVFIVISDSARNMGPAMWGKAGQVMGWSLFLGNESTNNWNGWFDHTAGAAKNAAGGVLEGSVNLQNEFGYIPNKLWIAVGQYGTNDNGTLNGQVPSGNGNGNIESDEFYLFDFTFTSIKDDPSNGIIPASNYLAQNYPNPFNPATNIRFGVQNTGLVKLKVYDVTGKEVAELVNDVMQAGNYTVNFDASKLPSGVYFYSVTAGDFRATNKMILMK